MKRFLIVFAVLAALLSCNGSRKAEKTAADFDRIFKEVRSEFAPDRRVRTFEAKIEFENETGMYVLRGSATEAEAKDELLKRLRDDGIEVLDSVVMLPDKNLEGKIFGVTALSVINFRYSPDYSSESATQTILGTPLRILEKRGGWTRAVTPERYIAWVSSGSVRSMNQQEYDNWRSSQRLIITSHYVLFREKPSPNADVVMDGVMGGIVNFAGTAGSYYKVTLPGGREAYLQRSDALPLEKWVDSRDPSPDNIIKTARQFLGFPYMWAGTSPKAMDCSGFTKTVFLLNGIILERDASQQGLTGEGVNIENGFDSLRRGDLIFFGSKATDERKERITHVGIYIGSGEFIHSATTIRINSLLPEAPNYYEGSDRLLRARRIINKIDADEGIVSLKKHPWYFNL